MAIQNRLLIGLAVVIPAFFNGIACDQALHEHGHQLARDLGRSHGVSATFCNTRASNVCRTLLTNLVDFEKRSPNLDLHLFGLDHRVPQLDKTNKSVKATQALYDDCKRKGEGLLCRLTDPESTPSQQSTWAYDDLTRWGWRHDEDEDGQGSISDSYPECVQALEGKGLQGAGSQEIFDRTWKHDRSFTNSAGQHPGSNAHFHNSYSPHAGVIIANSNESPAHMKTKDPGAVLGISTIVLPDLQRWSDVTWLEWAHLCEQEGANPGDLKYVIREYIKNEDTIDVIEAVLSRRNLDREPDWPGLTVDPASDEGQALLGTPNGRGIPWLLLQHRNRMSKKIKEITVWMPAKATWGEMYFMMFQLE